LGRKRVAVDHGWPQILCEVYTVTDGLRRESLRVWHEYGEAVKSAFGFPPTARISAEGLDDFFRDGTDQVAHLSISYVRRQIEETRSMKFVGEK
jgi:hypothetical protein